MNSNSSRITVFILLACFATSQSVPVDGVDLFQSGASYLFCLGGKNENDSSLFSVSKLNPAKNEWSDMPELTTPKYYFGASTIGKKIYVCGGNTGHKKLKYLEVFDGEKNTWSALDSMPNARDEFGMTSLGEHIYVAGGMDDSNRKLSSVLKYSPETSNWTEVKSMNEPRYLHELVTLHGGIYAIGGSGTLTVERYSPLVDEWAYVAPTQHQHNYFGAVSHQNKIYVLSDNGFEVFHPQSDSWENLPSFKYFGSGTQLVSINDKLWAIGVGEENNNNKATKTIFEFDATKVSWQKLPDMDIARKYHRAVVVNL